MFNKMFNKKTIILFLIIVLAASTVLAGCSSKNGDGAKDGDSSKYVMRIGYASIGDPQDMAAQNFAEKLAERVGDRIEVQLFPAGQLGSNDAMLQQLQEGSMQGVLNPPAFFGGRYEPITMLDLPYLFETDLLTTVDMLNGEIGDKLTKGLEELGLVNLRFYPQGDRLVYTAFKVDNGLQSFKGKKIRAMEAQTQVDMYRSWGATGVPMGTPELYTALQQGTLDGIDSVTPFVYNMKLHEVLDTVFMAPNVPMPVMLVVNKAWLEELPEDLRNAVFEAAADDKELQQKSMEQIEESLKLVQDEGLKVVYPSDELDKELREKAKIVHDNFLKLNPEAVEMYNELVEYIESN